MQQGHPSSLTHEDTNGPAEVFGKRIRKHTEKKNVWQINMKHPSPQVSAHFEYKEEHIVCL